MDIIKWHIIDSTFICCETLMLLLLANSFLPRRAKWWGWVFAIVAPIALQQLSDVLSLDAPYGAFPHFILDVIIVFLLYKERFLKKIGVTLLYYLIMAVCEGLVMAILSFTIGYDLANVTEHDTHQVICMVLAHLVILFGVAVVSLAVRRIRAHNRFSIPIRYWIPLVLLPLFEFVIIMLWIPYNRGTAPAEDTVALIVVVLMLVFSTLFTWLLLYRLSEMHFESVVVSKEEKRKAKIALEQYEAANCYDQWVRKQVHDLRKQIDYLRQHTDDGTILDYAKEVDERLIGLSLTGNADIDAFLRYKAKLARKSGIHLHVTGHLPTELPGDPMPVITLLANAVDNAIEGSMEVTDSIEKTVDVQFGFQDRRLYLSVRNPTKLKRAPEPPYRTTKTDKYQHGFGLYSIQETVDSYDGVLELSVANGVFHLFAILQMSESVLHRKEGVDCVS